MNIKGLSFIKTCSACPEQYDVEYDGKQVGYIRLRYGGLTVEYPDVGGEIIYEASIGDGWWTGEFDSEEQRQYHLNNIADTILEKIGWEYEPCQKGDK